MHLVHHHRLVCLLLMLIASQVKCQTSSESSENEIAAEALLDDELLATTTLEIGENTTSDVESTSELFPSTRPTISDSTITDADTDVQVSIVSDSSNPTEPPNGVTEGLTGTEEDGSSKTETDSTKSTISDSLNPGSVTETYTTEEVISTAPELDSTKSTMSDSLNPSSVTETFTTVTELESTTSSSSSDIPYSESKEPTTTQPSPIDTTTTGISTTANYSPNITISLPTFAPDINEKPNITEDVLCRENEVYSCLPLCRRTCNNPLSKIICFPVPSHIHLCLRGCTCKAGYLLEKTIGKCVKECPAKQRL